MAYGLSNGHVTDEVMRSSDLNHAPFGENYLCACSGFPKRSRVQNL